MFGHSQPLVQSLQQSHSQLQFGQSLQHSFEQQVASPVAGVPAVAEVLRPATLAATTPVARSRPLNNLVNM